MCGTWQPLTGTEVRYKAPRWPTPEHRPLWVLVLGLAPSIPPDDPLVSFLQRIQREVLDELQAASIYRPPPFSAPPLCPARSVATAGACSRSSGHRGAAPAPCGDGWAWVADTGAATTRAAEAPPGLNRGANDDYRFGLVRGRRQRIGRWGT